MLGAREVKRAKVAADEAKELRGLRVARLVDAGVRRGGTGTELWHEALGRGVRRADVRRAQRPHHNVACGAFSTLVALRPNQALLLSNAKRRTGGDSGSPYRS